MSFSSLKIAAGSLLSMKAYFTEMGVVTVNGVEGIVESETEGSITFRHASPTGVVTSTVSIDDDTTIVWGQPKILTRQDLYGWHNTCCPPNGYRGTGKFGWQGNPAIPANAKTPTGTQLCPPTWLLNDKTAKIAPATFQIPWEKIAEYNAEVANRATLAASAAANRATNPTGRGRTAVQSAITNLLRAPQVPAPVAAPDASEVTETA